MAVCGEDQIKLLCGDSRDCEITLESNKNPDFRFSFMSSSEFNSVLKQVKRERQKKQEAKDWEKFLSKKQAMESSSTCPSSVKHDASNNPYHSDYKQLQLAEYLLEEEKMVQLTKLKRNQQISKHQLEPEVHIKMESATTQLGSNLTKSANENIIINLDSSRVKQEIITFKNIEPDDKEPRKVDKKFAMKKFLNSQRKIIMALKGIERALTQTTITRERSESDIFHNRRLNIAFAARFRRNYHYHLACQIWEIEKLIKLNSQDKVKASSVSAKLLSAHQVISQALQAVEKHIFATFPLEEPFSWLKEFIDATYHVCLLSSSFDKDMSNYVEEVKVACEELNVVINEFNNKLVDARLVQCYFISKPKKRYIAPEKCRDTLWMYRNNCKKTKKARTGTPRCIAYQ